MANNKKYYYLKLKENFFDTDEMIILESMPDGHLYSNILLKLYLRSLKNEGRLMFNDRIPFNSTMLAQVTRHNIGVVEKAMSIFKELGLIEILDNGTIFMSDIQSFIGEGSTEADRIREYRKRIEAEKITKIGGCTNVQQMYDKCTPEIEREKELELEKEKELDLELEKNPCQLYADEYNTICHSMPKCIKMTAKRRKVINTVKKTFSNEEIKQAFISAEASDFLTNRNGKGFTAGFDWIMNVSNMTKILEGNYKNKNIKPSGGNKTFLEMYQEQKESGGNTSEVNIDL